MSNEFGMCFHGKLEPQLTALQAWKQSTLGAADALFAKAEAHFAKLTDVTSIEKFVDALLKIGKDLMGQNVHDRAVLWLKRAYDVINKIDAELIVDQGQELQLGIMHNLGISSSSFWWSFVRNSNDVSEGIYREKRGGRL